MTKKCFFLLLIFTGVLFSCSKQQKERNQLSDEVLVNLMFDLHLAEVVIPSMHKNHQDSLRDIYWEKLSEVYGLTEDEIRREVDILESDPEKMKEIIGLVKARADSIKF